MFLFILQIFFASQNDWLITIDYNLYGEGVLELILMIIFCITITIEYSIKIKQKMKLNHLHLLNRPTGTYRKKGNNIPYWKL